MTVFFRAENHVFILQVMLNPYSRTGRYDQHLSNNLSNLFHDSNIHHNIVIFALNKG